MRSRLLRLISLLILLPALTPALGSSFPSGDQPAPCKSTAPSGQPAHQVPTWTDCGCEHLFILSDGVDLEEDDEVAADWLVDQPLARSIGRTLRVQFSATIPHRILHCVWRC